MYRSCLAVSLALAIVWASGCSPSGPGLPPTTKVKGTVNLDGKPVAAAELHFELPGAPPSVLTVKEGAFAGDAPVGKSKVELFIYKEGAASGKYAGTTTKTNIAPRRYWGPNTTLEATVTAGAANEIPFNLTSK
jgi:hypothetical protein